MHGRCSPACLHLCVPLWSGRLALSQIVFIVEYSKILFSQVTEDEYPYTSGDPWGDGDDQKCKFDARTTEVDTYTIQYTAKEVKSSVPDLGAK